MRGGGSGSTRTVLRPKMHFNFFLGGGLYIVQSHPLSICIYQFIYPFCGGKGGGG